MLGIGELVLVKPSARWKKSRTDASSSTGIILDSMEMDDGFFEFEVLLDSGEVEWFSDIEISSMKTHTHLKQ